MKVRELISLLQEVIWQDAEVRAWDADADEYLPVTGVIHGEPGSSTVDLQTDEA